MARLAPEADLGQVSAVVGIAGLRPAGLLFVEGELAH
jgi:hypothetical protein